MGESHHQASTSSRLGIRNTGGEIVEVQGGHIVRSTGRKDRHSKVCTAKGPRDRRVRLSAHTAIQFYDVQDRLGYDRPSKAVDWLIKKAKPAIDELAELPAWHPTATTATTKRSSQQEHQMNDESKYQFPMVENIGASPGNRRTATMVGNSEVQNIHHHQQQQQMGENLNNSSSFLPPSLDSDSIADTIKSFFPIGATTEGGQSSSIQFQSYPPDLLSRTSSQNQDLRLSLQSFQEPMLLQHHHHHHQVHQPPAHQNEQQVLFSGTTHLGFVSDGSSAGWTSEQQHHHQHPAEVGRFQRMVVWNGGAADTGSGGGGSGSGGAFMFNSPPPLQPFFGQDQLFSQRGPLQSSNTPSVRAWINPAAVTIAAEDSQHQHHHHHHHHQISSTIHHQSAISGTGFTSPGGFSGFRIPARIQGEEEEHDGIHNKPSSGSSDSRH